jgi:hypothetical protein
VRGALGNAFEARAPVREEVRKRRRSGAVYGGNVGMSTASTFHRMVDRDAQCRESPRRVRGIEPVGRNLVQRDRDPACNRLRRRPRFGLHRRCKPGGNGQREQQAAESGQ